MSKRLILDSKKMHLVLQRLCHQLIENHRNFENTVIIGVQPRGVLLADILTEMLKDIANLDSLQYGKLDITFYRDDFRTNAKPIQANATAIDFSLEDKEIILIDDVLYTGRTIRSALDALLDFGRPKDVELLVLIDRRLHRHVPIQAKYVGKTIDSISDERVKVEWKHQGEKENKVWLLDKS